MELTDKNYYSEPPSKEKKHKPKKCPEDEIWDAIFVRKKAQGEKNNKKLKKLRVFKVKGEKKFFEYHIKNFIFGYRLHFFSNASDKKIYIGYFGPHLPTKDN